MKLKPNQFIFLSENENDYYIDTAFFDRSPKGGMREWRLTLDTKTGRRWATLLRAPSETDPFEYCVELPRKFVRILMDCL